MSESSSEEKAVDSSISRPESGKWRGIFILFLIAGILLAIKLAQIYVRVRLEPSYHSFCAINDQWNCDTVALTKWAIFLKVPVAVWGLFGYTSMILLALSGIKKSFRPVPAWPLGFLFLLSCFCVFFAAVMGYISIFHIDSLCILCLSVYAVNLILLVISILAIRGTRLGFLRVIAEDIFAVLVAPAKVIGLTAGPVIIAALIPIIFSLTFHEVTYELILGPSNLPVGVTEDGHFWIGAVKPAVVIEEYLDFKCPYCKNAQSWIKRLVFDNRNKVRLVVKNFPLDKECNPSLKKTKHRSACQMAGLAYCAGQQGKFWLVSDLLFIKPEKFGKKNLQDTAAKLGINYDTLQTCMESEQCRDIVNRDVEAGNEMGMKSTPGFVVDGTLYQAFIPNTVLQSLIPDYVKPVASLPAKPKGKTDKKTMEKEESESESAPQP